MYWIEKATAHPDFTVTIQWRDGAESTVDFKPTIAKGGVCEPMADPDYFTGKMQVDEDGRSLGWPGEVDFCADSLWYRTHPEGYEREFGMEKKVRGYRWVRVELRCLDWTENEETQTETWPYSFDIIVDGHGFAVKNAVERYCGYHRYYDSSESAPTSCVVPVLLITKTGRIVNYIENSDGSIRKDDHRINLLDKSVLIEEGFKEICLYEADAANQDVSCVKSYYEIIRVRDICSELNKFGEFKVV